MRRRTRASRLAAAAALAVAVLALPSIASGAVTCVFDDGTGIVDVVLGADGDAATVSVDAGAVAVDGTPCGTATTATVDLIRVRDTSAGGSTALTIDLGGGQFAPGADDEVGSSDEIEFDVDLGDGAGDVLKIAGAETGDNVVVGTDGIQLDATEIEGVDADVAPLAGVEAVELDGGAGNDVLRGDGGAGTSAPTTLPLTLLGGSGADVLAGGAGPDVFEGGDGFDMADYSTRTDPLTVTLDGVAGDGGSGELDDVRPTVEQLRGGTGDDQLTGADVANLLEGGPGADTLTGLGGDDTIRGEEGDDAIYGGDGYDLIEGGLGTDQEFGEGNNDVFQMSSPTIWRSSGDPVPIPNDGTPLVLEMNVTTPGQMRDINVRFDIEHTDPSDLYVATISPGSSEPNVMTNRNGAGNPTQMRGITFDSESVATIKRDGGTFPLDGRFHPRGSLDSEYRGKQAAGIWRLVVRDDDPNGGTGQINWWSLDINYTTNQTDGVGDVLDGGDGNFDMADYTARSKNLRISLADGAANDGMKAERDQILNIEDTYAGTGNDVLRGTDARNDIRGHLGDDTIYLFDGSDKARGGRGKDVIYGGPGNDVTLYGNDDDDIIYGEDGDDRIDAGSGSNDTADGGLGTDVCRLAEQEFNCEPVSR